MKKLLSVVLCVVLITIAIHTETDKLNANAATSLPNGIYIAQATDYTCTLASATMMLRARTYLSGNSNWSLITESAVEPVAWGSGLKWSFTYTTAGISIKVGHTSVSGISISSLKTLLNSHPEGIVLYCKFGSSTHAVLVTDYEGDVFYCADPVSSYSGKRITIASSWLGKICGSQSTMLSSATAYWYVSNYNITNNSSHTHNYNTYSHYLSAHPHYKCYKCSCGEVQTNKSETTYVSSCATCNPKISFENIESGNYYIKQKGNGRYLSIAGSEDKDLANVHTNDFGNYNSQVFSIYTTDYGYEMMPACSSTRVVNPSTASVKSGNAVNLYSKSNKNSQSWKFQPLNGGYVIRNAKNTNVCISPGDGGMAVLEYAGWDSQIWYLEKCCTISFDAKGGEGAPEPQRMRAGYGTDLSSQKPTKVGFAFSGWSTSSKATTVTYTAGQKITVENDTTLYAVWKKCTHKYANNSNICSLCGFDKSGDVNGDGNITLDDVVLLAQYVAGWDVTLN